MKCSEARRGEHSSMLVSGRAARCRHVDSVGPSFAPTRMPIPLHINRETLSTSSRRKLQTNKLSDAIPSFPRWRQAVAIGGGGAASERGRSPSQGRAPACLRRRCTHSTQSNLAHPDQTDQFNTQQAGGAAGPHERGSCQLAGRPAVLIGGRLSRSVSARLATLQAIQTPQAPAF